MYLPGNIWCIQKKKRFIVYLEFYIHWVKIKILFDFYFCLLNLTMVGVGEAPGHPSWELVLSVITKISLLDSPSLPGTVLSP